MDTARINDFYASMESKADLTANATARAKSGENICAAIQRLTDDINKAKDNDVRTASVDVPAEIAAAMVADLKAKKGFAPVASALISGLSRITVTW